VIEQLRISSCLVPTTRHLANVSLALCVVLILTAASPALALFKIDFEQKFFVHPKRQVWDFCIVRPDSVYHIFYHGIHEDTPHATNADTIWHATSPDLSHWEIAGPAVTVSDNWWEEVAIWAPDVIWEDTLGKWAMAYTGVDTNRNQRTCFAYSTDLETWTKDPLNPIVEPNPEIYVWDPLDTWGDFRDPYLYHQDGQWHLLNSALLRNSGGNRQGAIHHAVSNHLRYWTELEPIFINNGNNPSHVLESAQYNVRDGWHHLYFGEYAIYGISHVSATAPELWDMANRNIIDWGKAPEIKQFDPGIDIFARIAAYQDPNTEVISYCVRLDTLLYDEDGALPDPWRPHPLDADWAEQEGTACVANPCFGDKPAIRGEGSCGLVGNNWFGSQEYYQGPLSGRGSPGTRLGDAATGRLTSHPFIIVGHRMELLVGGGDFPETCYVALVDAETDTIIYSETGNNRERMTPRQWDLTPYQGRLAYVQIVDDESANYGHINVDEIEEIYDPATAVGELLPTTVALVDHGPAPNPFNPATTLRYTLMRPGAVEIRVHDLRGRVVWQSLTSTQTAGSQQLTWRGFDASGREAPSGTYLYSIRLDGRLMASGKLSLMK